MIMRVPEPSDEAPDLHQGEGTLHRYEQFVAAVVLFARQCLGAEDGARILEMAQAADVMPFSLEQCPRCQRLGLPCDYCHDPRNDGSEMWHLCWEMEEDEN
jgi:hypothetical protein